ncbi:MAG: hypothetical protein SGCHY_000168 [Lobulomycetales sp.]
MHWKALGLFSILVGLVLAWGESPHHDSGSNYGDNHKVHEEVNEAMHHIDPDHKEHYDADDDDKYYYFSLHDLNHDSHLDGHEMREALYLPQDGSISLAEAEKMIDHIMEEDDHDNDGMISWEEYLESQEYHNQV